MNQQTEQEIYKFMGRISEAVENIEKKICDAPCIIGRHEKRISDIEGRMTTFSVVAGFIGSIIFAVISWALGKIRF